MLIIQASVYHIKYVECHSLIETFHSPVVTSNLAIHSQLAHHRQGGGTITSQREKGVSPLLSRF